MATTESVLPALPRRLAAEELIPDSSPRKRLDLCLIAGIVIAAAAIIAGISCTGVGLLYFLQPTGAAIVLGGTLGVILITTPGHSLVHSLRRVRNLLATREINRESLIEEIIFYSRTCRRSGILSVEPLLPKAKHEFLRDALQLAVDVRDREELRTVLEMEIKLAERQGEADAKALEVAGGFAPTIGIMGTVVGLIEVLRQFSNLQSVGFGIGTAFVSTMYGLALANLLLLPAAHRIRSRVAENFETRELVMEGVLAIVDSVHPSMVRARLNCFLRGSNKPRDVEQHVIA